MSLAALPWYDFAEPREQINAWWAGIARHLPALGVEHTPAGLLRGRELAADAYAELEDFEEPALAVGYRQLPAPERSPLTRGEVHA